MQLQNCFYWHEQDASVYSGVNLGHLSFVVVGVKQLVSVPISMMLI